MEAIDKIPESFYPPPELRTDRLKAILEHDKKYALYRPAVPGEAIDYIYAPPMGFMRGRVIKKGQVIRTIDLEGQQVVDIVIWDANDLDNVLSDFWTEVLNERWNYWKPGDAFFSKNCNKLATITEDTTEGLHSATGYMCMERYWYAKFGVSGSVNCRDNLVAAMAEYGFSANDIDYGSCFNFFLDIRRNPDGTFGISVARTKPGDYIDLMAERDIIMAYSNCPAIRSRTNDHNPTALMSVIFNPNKDYRAKADALPRPDVFPA